MVVVNLVNADVLPSFMEDDIVKLQMVAFPVSIDYYPDEDAYADAQPDEKNGRKWLLADGTIFPTGFMTNHDPEREDCEKNDWMDDHVLIRGTVKALYHGRVVFGDIEKNTFIRCIIETQYGDLELVHSIDQVKEEQHGSIRVGAVVTGVCVLSGDAAIDDYEKGAVYDEEHDLRLLRSTFSGGDTERMRNAFAEDAVYASDSNGKQYSGRDDIIARLRYVQENAEEESFAHMAVIVSVDDGETSLPYGEGKRCVVLAAGEEDKYESIAFIEINPEGHISKLYISKESRYHFKIDENYCTVRRWRTSKNRSRSLSRF